MADEEEEKGLLLQDDEEGASPLPINGCRDLLWFWSTTANTLCTMIGGGILALPYIFHAASLCVSLTTTLLGAVVCTASVYCLVVCCEVCHKFTFKDLVMAAFPDRNPRRVSKAVESLVFCSNITTMVVYFRLIGDSMPPVADFLAGGRHGAWSNDKLWIFASAGVFVALASLRTLRELFLVALLGTFSMLYISFVVIVKFWVPPGPKPTGSELNTCHFDAQFLPAFNVGIGDQTIKQFIVTRPRFVPRICLTGVPCS